MMETEVRSEHKYVDVADRIERLIENGVLKVGDKLLSVRALSKEQGISLSTAFQSYYHLESKGLIEARPQSGYYVKFAPNENYELPVACCGPPKNANEVTIDEMINNVYRELRSPNLINFSLGSPSHKLLPAAKLNKSVMQALRDSETSCLHYEEIQGNVDLRKQIARQAFNWGGVYKEDDIVVTAGCLEAMSFCLKAVTQPGDAVAIDSPTYFGIFQVMQTLGLKVVEIPCDPVAGVDLNYLDDAIDKFDIKACLFVTNFNNPLGSCIPDEKKEELVKMLAKKQVPMIEDDIYGELYFGKTRPKTCKSFDKEGLVLYCSSFSKSLAPGHRIGWAIPGKFKDKVIPIKRMHCVSTNTLSQAAIAHFLDKGRYELHLRHLRKALHTNSLRYIQSVLEHLPDDTRLTRPQGGFTLWLELGKKINTYELHKKALDQHVGIAPGKIFSLRSNYENCFRIGFGEPWSKDVDNGIRKIGRIIKEM